MAADLVAALREPSFWGATEPVELRETHISWVFLTGERAYKLKKPIRLPFLDYTTAELRRAMCEAEVALNRRLAPDLYLGVRAVVERDGGLALGAPDDPGARDFLVEMRRFDESETLAARADAGRPLPVAEVGARLARFHASATPVGDRDPVAALSATLEATVETLGSFVEADDADALAVIAAFTRAWLEGRGTALRERATRGLVRDGHGDLRAEHVICAPGIAVVDCVEFDPALRAIDVGFDLAYLVMDLLARGHEHAAAELVRAYRDAGGDPGDDAVLAFFAANRAVLMAEVLAMRGGQDAGAEVRRHLALAERFAWRARAPLVVACAGVTGSGKSTLAAELARRSGLPSISSDVVRKRGAGLEPTARGGDDLYTDEVTRETYAKLGRLARAAVAEHGGAIVDATFHRAANRQTFLEALGDAPAPVWLHCVAPPEVLRARVAARTAAQDRVSDATGAVLDRQLAAWEPPDAAVAIDTDQDPVATVAAVRRALDARLAGEHP